MKQSAKHGSHLRFFTVLHRDGTTSIVKGYAVSPHAFAAVPYKVDPCFVARDEKNPKTWRVSDVKTGSWIAFDGSPDKAIYAATLRLVSKGENAYARAAVQASARRAGAVPRVHAVAA